MTHVPSWMPSEERYIERCRLKTGKLFEAACRIGAVLGDPGRAAADGLGAFGERIGLAFQLFDDILDVSGPPDQTGSLADRRWNLLESPLTLLDQIPVIAGKQFIPAVTGKHHGDAFRSELGNHVCRNRR